MSWSHGTRYGYTAKGCRCVECKAAESVRKRAYFDRLAARDPEAYDRILAKAQARKKRYRGVCEDCGGPTTGCNGKEKAPRYCATCTNKRREPAHGTRSRYGKGCSCDACRAANRESMRRLMGKPPPTHGASGYVNYGCRCDVCARAHRDYQWMRPEWRRGWERKVRGTEPPKHGTAYAYKTYGCHCDACREAGNAYERARRARKRAAA